MKHHHDTHHNHNQDETRPLHEQNHQRTGGRGGPESCSYGSPNNNNVNTFVNFAALDDLPQPPLIDLLDHDDHPLESTTSTGNNNVSSSSSHKNSNKRVSAFAVSSGFSAAAAAGRPPSHPHHRRLISSSSLMSANTTTATTTSHQQRVAAVLVKTPQSSFYQDALAFRPGSVPHSMVLGLTIGIVCGIAAWGYYAVLDYSLELLWKRLPQQLLLSYDSINDDVTVEDNDQDWRLRLLVLQPLWIPLVGFAMAFLVGLTVRYLGEPGDLAYTIQCVHEKGYISMNHVLPMLVASQFSILAGGSLGPEAPLVAICASLGGFVSRRIFKQTSRNMIRKHTLMGMAGALAAFFGAPLGGSLFALEVNSRFGIEYFEHTLEAIFCGEVSLAVFRSLSGLPISSIWVISADKLTVSEPLHVLYGAVLGLLGATTAWLFANFHKRVMQVFREKGLLHNRRAVPRAMAGASVVVALGLLIPHTLFWGEFEFQTIATLAPASALPHVWPTFGLLGFEMNSFATALIVGLAKLVAISFTVAGGYRGGYIFPAFCAAAALGRAVYFVCPFIPVQLCVLGMAAALNTALTRTAVASTLILTFLSGEQCSGPCILAASLVSLFVTAYMPFIHTQHIMRGDLHEAIFHEYELEVHDEEEDEDDDSTEEEDCYCHSPNKHKTNRNSHHRHGESSSSSNSTSATDMLTPMSVLHKCCDEDAVTAAGRGGGVHSNANGTTTNATVNDDDPPIITLLV